MPLLIYCILAPDLLFNICPVIIEAIPLAFSPFTVSVLLTFLSKRLWSDIVGNGLSCYFMLWQMEVGVGSLRGVRVQICGGALPQPWAQYPQPPYSLCLMIPFLYPSWNGNWCPKGFLPGPVSKATQLHWLPDSLCNLEGSHHFCVSTPLVLITCSLPPFWRVTFHLLIESRLLYIKCQLFPWA